MNVAELLQIPAEVMPDVPLIRAADNELSYGEFTAATVSLGAWLEDMDIRPGSVVSTVQMLSVPHLALMFATFSVGAVFNPLNYRSRDADLKQLLAQASSSLVVADDRYVELVTNSVPVTSGAQVKPTSAMPVTGEDDAGLWPVEVEDDQLALLLFTSGTTGTPKPVKLLHSALTATILENTTPPDGERAGCSLVSVPTYHVAGLTTVLTSVFMGRCLALLPQFDPGSWVDKLGRSGADHAFCVPTMLKQILDYVDETHRAPALANLKTLAYGAAPMPPKVITRAITVFPETCDFVNAYGQTETLGTVTMLLPDDHRMAAADGDRAAKLERLGSVGRAVPGVDIAILDDAGHTLGHDVVGEVAIRRDGVAPSGAGGWHQTGDVGMLDTKGYLFLRGRLGDLIIRGGENIDPTEIEHALENHPSVAEAAVVGEADDEWGEVIVAYVVPTPGQDVQPVALKEHVRRQLAGFKVPTEIQVLPELPRNSMGKTLKRELRRRVLQ